MIQGQIGQMDDTTLVIQFREWVRRQLLGQPAPPGPKPGTSARELGFLVVEAVIGDLGAGKSEPEMKADIQAVLDAN